MEKKLTKKYIREARRSLLIFIMQRLKLDVGQFVRLLGGGADCDIAGIGIYENDINRYLTSKRKKDLGVSGDVIFNELEMASTKRANSDLLEKWTSERDTIRDALSIYDSIGIMLTGQKGTQTPNMQNGMIELATGKDINHLLSGLEKETAYRLAENIECFVGLTGDEALFLEAILLIAEQERAELRAELFNMQVAMNGGELLEKLVENPSLLKWIDLRDKNYENNFKGGNNSVSVSVQRIINTLADIPVAELGMVIMLMLSICLYREISKSTIDIFLLYKYGLSKQQQGEVFPSANSGDI